MVIDDDTYASRAMECFVRFFFYLFPTTADGGCTVHLEHLPNTDTREGKLCLRIGDDRLNRLQRGKVRG